MPHAPVASNGPCHLGAACSSALLGGGDGRDGLVRGVVEVVVPDELNRMVAAGLLQLDCGPGAAGGGGGGGGGRWRMHTSVVEAVAAVAAAVGDDRGGDGPEAVWLGCDEPAPMPRPSAEALSQIDLIGAPKRAAAGAADGHCDVL